MQKINCLLADDEALSREILENYVRRLGHLRLVAACKNGTEVFNALKTQAVDLLFLDIQMPQLTGIDLLKSLQQPPAVVFTTAYRDYALEGYELNVLDYLLKPISFDRFLKAVDKYENGRAANARFTASVDGFAGFLNVKAGKKTLTLPVEDVLFIEGRKDCVKIKTTGREIVTYQPLAEFERRLANRGFLRVHRSFIVSVNKVRSFSATVLDVAGTEIPIGHRYQRDVLVALHATGDETGTPPG